MTNTTIVIALAMLLACRGSDHSAANKTRELPIPTKLPPPTAPAQTPDHAKAIDTEYATLLAMYNAPDGATPCESAYNAVTAEQDAAKNLKRDSIFSFVAPKDSFMKECQKLIPARQSCLSPKYQSHNAAECEGAKIPDADLAKLYVLRKDLAPVKEPTGALSP